VVKLLRYGKHLPTSWSMDMYTLLTVVRTVQTRIAIANSINPLSQIHLRLSRLGIFA
jgi:hypothetical protein